MPTYTLSALTILLLAALSAYLFHQARRKREGNLSYKLRKCEIALHDAEQSLENTIYFYKEEIARLQRRLDEAGPSPSLADQKFRQAKPAFARLYHPDRQTGDDQRTRVRVEIFKEFRDELQRIENGR